MKKFYSITFLFLFLLSSVGYYAMLSLSKNQIAKKVMQKIEKNADNISGNLILRIPMTLPYGQASTEYTRVDGEITFQGELYRKVKQRLYKDTLYMVCIKDYQSKEIKGIINEFVKTFTDDLESSTSGIKILHAFSKDYIQGHLAFSLSAAYPIKFLSHTNQYINLYYFIPGHSIFHPPLFGAA